MISSSIKSYYFSYPTKNGVIGYRVESKLPKRIGMIAGGTGITPIYQVSFYQ